MIRRAVQTPGQSNPPSDETQEAGEQIEDTGAPPADEKPAKTDKPAEALSDEDYREKARGLRAKDVDATKLKRSVLTLDGWVCPAKLDEPAAKE